MIDIWISGKLSTIYHFIYWKNFQYGLHVLEVSLLNLPYYIDIDNKNSGTTSYVIKLQKLYVFSIVINNVNEKNVSI